MKDVFVSVYSPAYSFTHVWILGQGLFTSVPNIPCLDLLFSIVDARNVLRRVYFEKMLARFSRRRI